MRQTVFLLFAWFASTSMAGTTFHVSNSGSHAPPFSSPSTAATNIQAAVDLASDGDIVLIADGSYALSAPVAVSNAIWVAAETGPSNTLVDGGGSVRCFWVADVDCVISGLTITNGLTGDAGGGVHCEGPSPVVTNCVISGCSAYAGGGMAGGTLRNSVVENNTASYEGGGLFETRAHNSTISANSALSYAGGGISGDAEASGCHVLNNYSAQYSGGMEGGVASNCLFQGNMCEASGGRCVFCRDLQLHRGRQFSRRRGGRS
jgi:hypothetical protein